MDSKILTDVLDKLIGPFWPIGESNADTERLKNLKLLIDATSWCLDGLAFCAENRHSFEGSVRDNGELAFSSLLEFKNYIENVEEELK